MTRKDFKMIAETMEINDLIGKKLIKIVGAKKDSDEFSMYFDDGTLATFNHYQDCCESVYIEDVIGDPQAMVGHALSMAEEVDNPSVPEDANYHDASHTWTFYKFAAGSEYVTIRWLGESNGYYSESVYVTMTRRIN